MADRPILFSAPMVRALLAGTKTQTRRVLKADDNGRAPCFVDGKRTGDARPDLCQPPFTVTRIAVGDRLWVRESWKAHSTFEGVKPRDIPPSKVFYLADTGYSPSGSRGRPGMFMPRWASRLTLTVTDVRVQRLQDISEADARAEGCPLTHDGRQYEPPVPEFDSWQGYGRASFSLLWSQINGPAAWDENPWVAAYTFTVEHANIDAIGGAA